MSIRRSCGPDSTHISAVGLFLLFAICLPLEAQELEPRAFAPNPAGVNFLLGTWSHTEGGVLVDPSVPITDVEATVRTLTAGYSRTFGLADHVASVALVVPYAELDATGEVFEEARTASRSGLGDLRFRFTFNLRSGTALDPASFARNLPDTTLGASLLIVAPTGEYRSDKLINLGSNRWAFKPELGGSWRIGPWTLESSAGAWLFTDNEAYFGGVTREQEPIGTLQGHVSYTFRPRLWLAVSGTWYTGGQTTVGDEHKRDLQRNSRVGLTLAAPVTSRHSVKLSWNTSTATRVGGDFDTWLLAWQYLWFD